MRIAVSVSIIITPTITSLLPALASFTIAMTGVLVVVVMRVQQHMRPGGVFGRIGQVGFCGLRALLHDRLLPAVLLHGRGCGGGLKGMVM